MKHWRTTLFGILQAIGWIFLGIALYADLAGLPKNYTYAHMGFAGCVIIAFGALMHGIHAADKQHVKLLIIAALFLSVSAVNSQAQEMPVPVPVRNQIKVMVIRTPIARLQTINPNCPSDKHDANLYFFKQIDACTNTVQLLAISNTVASH